MGNLARVIFILMLSSKLFASDDDLSFNLKLERAKEALNTTEVGQAFLAAMSQIPELTIKPALETSGEETGRVNFEKGAPVIYLAPQLSVNDLARGLAHQFIHYQDAVARNVLFSSTDQRPIYAEEAYMRSLEVGHCLMSKKRQECEKKYGESAIRANLVLFFAAEYRALIKADFALAQAAPRLFDWQVPEEEVPTFINENYLSATLVTPISEREVASLAEETKALDSEPEIYRKYFPTIFE